MTQRPVLLPGQHVCWAAEGATERARLVAEWAREGLERGERLLFVEPSAPGRGLPSELDGRGADLSGAKAGQVVTIPAGEAHTLDGVFDPEPRVRAYAAWIEESLDEGYAAVRLWGDAAEGLALAPDTKTWLRYETLIDGLCSSYPVSVLCLYDREVFGTDLAPFVRSHPRAVADDQVRIWVEEGTVRLVGEIDLSNADLLGGVLAALGGLEVVIDMTGLEFIDVRGTAEVVRLAQRLGPQGVVKVASAPMSVRTVLRAAGWTSDDALGSVELAG